MSRIAVVFGATGFQGSSVINALFKDGTFTPRAITRHLDSPAAEILKSRGAQVVQADYKDPASLGQALEGAECVFMVTQPFDPTNGLSAEFQQGKNIIDASKSAGVKFLVWSSCPSATVLSGGRFKNLAHFDEKAKIDQYLLQSGLPGAVVQTAFFVENFIENSYRMLSKSSTDPNAYSIHVPRYAPTAEQTFTWIGRDLGPSVLALFKHYDQRDDISGRTFQVVTARMNYQDLASSLSKGLSKNVTFHSPETSGMVDMDEMFELQSTIGLFNGIITPDPRLVSLGVKFSDLAVDMVPYLKAHGY